MKKQLINYGVLIVLAVIANYPIYNSLQQSVKEAKSLIDQVSENIGLVRMEVVEFHQKLNSITERIDNGFVQADSALSQIKVLQIETDDLNSRIDTLKLQAVKKIERKMKQIIPGLPGF